MNLLFVVAALFIGDQVAGAALSEELVPQIKVTRIKLWEVNPKFINLMNFTISKHNATYNDIRLDWGLNQDLPKDSKFSVNLYASDAEYKTKKLLLSKSVQFCLDGSILNRISSNMARTWETSNCFEKGVYNIENVGFFRFENIIPNVHDISDYFYIDHIISSNNEILCNVTLYTEWGYLHTTD